VVAVVAVVEQIALVVDSVVGWPAALRIECRVPVVDEL